MDRHSIVEVRTWTAAGACRSHPEPGIWFTSNSAGERARSERAVAICRTCPVRVECLTYALVAREKYGTWGGMLPTSRKDLLEDRTMPRPCAHCLAVFVPADRGGRQGGEVPRFCVEDGCVRERHRERTRRARERQGAAA